MISFEANMKGQDGQETEYQNMKEEAAAGAADRLDVEQSYFVTYNQSSKPEDIM